MIVVPHHGYEETVVLFLEHHCTCSIAHSRKRISIRGTSAWKKKRYSSSFPGIAKDDDAAVGFLTCGKREFCFSPFKFTDHGFHSVFCQYQQSPVQTLPSSSFASLTNC